MKREEARKIQKHVLDSIAKDLFSKSDEEIESIINSTEDDYSEVLNNVKMFLGKAQEVENFYNSEDIGSVEYFEKEINVFIDELIDPMLSVKPNEFFRIDGLIYSNSFICEESIKSDSCEYSEVTTGYKGNLKGNSEYLSDEDCEQCPIAA